MKPPPVYPPPPPRQSDTPNDPSLRDIKIGCKTVRYFCQAELFAFYITHSEAEIAKLIAAGHAAFTAEEMSDFLAWAARARKAGTPYTMKDLMRWSRIRLDAHDLGLAYVGSYQPPPGQSVPPKEAPCSSSSTV